MPISHNCCFTTFIYTNPGYQSDNMALAATFIVILIVGITIPIDAAQTGYDARELQTLIEILSDSLKIEKKAQEVQTLIETSDSFKKEKKADSESSVDKLGETKKQTQYNYAECVFINNADLDPATAAKNDIRGTASMKQEKSGGPLVINIQVEGIDPKSRKQHGFHVHELGDLSNGCTSTGSHFNPEGMYHGGQKDVERHVGDWGNVDRSTEGTVDVQITDGLASLEGGNHNILGRAIVLHEKTDDLGKGGDEESRKTGNAGARLACCVIGLSKTEW